MRRDLFRQPNADRTIAAPQPPSPQPGPAVPDSTPAYLPRNFWLGVVSGVAYNVYIVVLSIGLVMTWFLSELTDSNLLISLLIPIEFGGWYFLQLLMSGYVQSRPYTLPLYRVMGMVRLIALALLALLTFLIDDRGTLLAVFFACFTVNALASGIAALPFLDVVSKTVPPRRRGMYFGWRRFLGGVLGLFGGLLVKTVLAPDFFLGFPDNYAFLFLLGLLIASVLVGAFSLIREPPGVVHPRHFSLSDQLRRAVGLPRQDRSYGYYLGIRLAVAAASFAVPFYAVYARRVLDAPEDMVGTYLIGSTAAAVLSNLFWGQLGDRLGNRLLMRVVAFSALFPPLLALLLPRLPGLGWEANLIFTLVFVFQGAHYTADAIGSTNYVMELAPAVERALYIGFGNAVAGLALFASPLAGAAVDWLGFQPLFLFSLICGLVAVVLALRLDEPRTMPVAS